MQKISRSYVQYCCILKRNIVVEETFHDGKKTLICAMKPECNICRNIILKNQFENCKTFTTDN